MAFAAKLKHELKAVGIATLYFGLWLGVLLLIKSLVLAEYRIAFHHWSLALVGALVLSKVVLLLANTICLSGALLGYNLLTVIRQHLGEGGLLRLFLERRPKSAP
jgi:hypothetical protein